VEGMDFHKFYFENGEYEISWLWIGHRADPLQRLDRTELIALQTFQFWARITAPSTPQSSIRTSIC
jgi:hypothetical protein